MGLRMAFEDVFDPEEAANNDRICSDSSKTAATMSSVPYEESPPVYGSFKPFATRNCFKINVKGTKAG
jgi:hypothetical protein